MIDMFFHILANHHFKWWEFLIVAIIVFVAWAFFASWLLKGGFKMDE